MYGFPDRRASDIPSSWHEEAASLHERLDEIEALAKKTHECMLAHVDAERETKAVLDEIILLWRGSKIMVGAFKFAIPVVAGLVAGLVWIKDHFKW
jgi:hypothetical protein